VERADEEGDGSQGKKVTTEYHPFAYRVVAKYGEAAAVAACMAEFGFPLLLVDCAKEAEAIERRLKRNV
jgi:hypothetical protein